MSKKALTIGGEISQTVGLGALVSTIVLAIIFYLLFTPISLIARLAGRDVLKLNKRRIDSYWVDRGLYQPTPDSFRKQF
jgi:hypothetical protein